LKAKELAVGDSTDLEIIYNTRTYRNRQSKKPSITYQQSTSDQSKHVEITAFVVSNPDSTYPIVIKPYKFNISQFGEATRDELTFEIHNVSPEDVEIKLVGMPVGMFSVELPKKVSAGKSKEGKIKLNKDYIDEEFEKSITIELSDKNLSRFTIPVKRQVRIPGKTSTAHSND